MMYFICRQKLGNREQDSILVQNLSQGLTLEFERSEGTRRLRLILSEILFILSQVSPVISEITGLYYSGQ